MAKTYLAVSETDYYGPETTRGIISIHEDAESAQAAADGHDPDYDPSVNARRLGNNQSSPTRGIVCEPIAAIEVGPWGVVWESLPAAVQAEIEPHLRDDDVSAALEASGYEVLWHEESNTYWLIIA